MKTWLDEPYARTLVNVALSLNEASKHRFNEENISVSYSDVLPTLEKLDNIKNALDEVAKTVAALPGHPGEYLGGFVRAFDYYLRVLQGDDIGYPELIRGIQQVDLERVAPGKIEALHAQLDEGLGRSGYSGTLGEKVNAWLNATALPADEIATWARDCLDKAKAATLERVATLPPEDEVDEVSPVRGVFWSAYSKYKGSGKGFIRLNVDQRWPEPVTTHILCHEGYPGHQAFYCLWDHLFRHDEWPLEASFYFINAPNNVLFEGGPENALRFLGWDRPETSPFGEEEQEQLRLADLYLDTRRAVNLNAAIDVNVNGASRQEAVVYIMDNGYLSEVEATNAYRFMTDPINRTYYPAYYYGRKVVGETFEALRHDTKTYFELLYRTPQTVETLAKAVEAAR